MMKKLKTTLKYHWPWLAWLFGIIFATILPGNYVPHVITFKEWMQPDKLIHIGLFAVLVFLSLRSYMTQFRGRHYRLIYTVVLIIAVSIGAGTELMQKHLLESRSGNVYDFGADALGCLTGLIIFYLAEKKILAKN